MTRLGFGSKVVITGDITQIDLPHDKVSGLKDAIRILSDIEDIAICHLTAKDVRHALVQKITTHTKSSSKQCPLLRRGLTGGAGDEQDNGHCHERGRPQAPEKH